MKTPLPVVIVLAAVAWVAARVVVCIYTALVELRNRFQNAYAQMDVQRKQRYREGIPDERAPPGGEG